MNESAISRFPIPRLDDLPADIRQRIEQVQEKAGFVPNIFLALAHRPAEFRAFFALSNRLANLAALQPNAEFYRLGRD